MRFSILSVRSFLELSESQTTLSFESLREACFACAFIARAFVAKSLSFSTDSAADSSSINPRLSSSNSGDWF